MKTVSRVPPYARQSFERDALHFHVFEDQLPPLGELQEVSDQAWGADYVDRCWYRFDEAALRWLLPGEGGHGVVVTDKWGDTVGCLVGSVRKIALRGKEVTAAFTTAMTMLPAGRGDPAVTLVRIHRDYVAERLGIDVCVGIFDNGASGGGRRVYTRLFEGDRSRRHLVTRPVAMWGASHDLPLCEQYAPLEGPARIAHLPGLGPLFEFRAGKAASALELERVSPASVPAPAGRWTLETLPAASLEEMYGTHQGDKAGVYRVRLPEGSTVHVAWYTMPVARRGYPDAIGAHLQLVWPGDASSSGLTLALKAVVGRLCELNPAFVTILDSGVVSRWVLLRAGFFTSERRVQFSIDAPEGMVSDLPLDGPIHFELL